MKTLWLVIVITIGLLVGGCGVAEMKKWHRADRTEQQTKIEYTDCYTRASGAWAADWKIFEECMHEKGFYRENGKVLGIWTNKK